MATAVTPQTLLHGAAMHPHVHGTPGGTLLQPCGLDGSLGGVQVPAAMAATVMAW